MVHTASAVEDRKRRTEAWQREAPDKVIESKAKAAESLRARWGLQIHRQHGFKNARICQAQSGPRAPTSAAVFFHIHRGCSANVMIHHRSWRTDKWSRMPKKKKKKKSPPRRRRRHSSQMTEQELEVTTYPLLQYLSIPTEWRGAVYPLNRMLLLDYQISHINHRCASAAGAQRADKAAQVTGTEEAVARPRVSPASAAVHAIRKLGHTEQAAEDSWAAAACPATQQAAALSSRAVSATAGDCCREAAIRGTSCLLLDRSDSGRCKVQHW